MVVTEFRPLAFSWLVRKRTESRDHQRNSCFFWFFCSSCDGYRFSLINKPVHLHYFLIFEYSLCFCNYYKKAHKWNIHKYDHIYFTICNLFHNNWYKKKYYLENPIVNKISCCLPLISQCTRERTWDSRELLVFALNSRELASFPVMTLGEMRGWFDTQNTSCKKIADKIHGSLDTSITGDTRISCDLH
jgi:hypothetical protein